MDELAIVTEALANQGLLIQSGPFLFNVRSRIASVAQNIAALYPGMITPNSGQQFADFHVAVDMPTGFRRLFYRQSQFYLDGKTVFNPFPLHHATAMLEWGMNWCVSTQIHAYLIVHAAVLEKNGQAVVMPAPPGSGKSTLCAALAMEGWRLFSDELTLFDLQTGWVWPMPRPVGLKNQSIDLVRQRYPHAVLGRVSQDTLKGSVAHLQPSVDSVDRQHNACPVAWVIFPQYLPAAETTLVAKSKGQTLLALADNAFNYSHLGAEGFDLLHAVVDQAACYQFTYSQLDETLALFNRLADGDVQ